MRKVHHSFWAVAILLALSSNVFAQMAANKVHSVNGRINGATATTFMPPITSVGGKAAAAVKANPGGQLTTFQLTVEVWAINWVELPFGVPFPLLGLVEIYPGSPVALLDGAEALIGTTDDTAWAGVEPDSFMIAGVLYKNNVEIDRKQINIAGP